METISTVVLGWHLSNAIKAILDYDSAIPGAQPVLAALWTSYTRAVAGQFTARLLRRCGLLDEFEIIMCIRFVDVMWVGEILAVTAYTVASHIC